MLENDRLALSFGDRGEGFTLSRDGEPKRLRAELVHFSMLSLTIDIKEWQIVREAGRDCRTVNGRSWWLQIPLGSPCRKDIVEEDKVFNHTRCND